MSGLFGRNVLGYETFVEFERLIIINTIVKNNLNREFKEKQK